MALGDRHRDVGRNSVQAVLLVHIIAGSLGLVSGFLALYAAKGAPLHRKVGMVFVSVMLTMTTPGSWSRRCAARRRRSTSPRRLMTAYLVVTGFDDGAAYRRGRAWAGHRRHGAGVRRRRRPCSCSGSRRSPTAARGTGCRPSRSSCSASSACWGASGDFRMLRSGVLRGAPRLDQALCGACRTALLITAMSFFIGQADVFPEGDPHHAAARCFPCSPCW